MSESTVLIKNYSVEDSRFSVTEREVWRYAGFPSAEMPNGELRELLAQVCGELSGSFSYRVCWRRLDLEREENGETPDFLHESSDLAKCLRGCGEIVIFAATVGLEIDRYVARNQQVNPTKALLAQAYGAERVECLCDVFCGEIKECVRREGLACTPRFSPGYGDLPLEAQRELFALLDCSRRIGVSLNGSLLMTPSKSVTAIFGLRKQIV